MKKNLLPIVVMFTINAYAQEGRVGINTVTPNTTLDVAGKPSDVTHLDGLQAPRLTRAELTAKIATYGANQAGALIYVTDVTGGNALTQRVNITAPGYYYFDGAVWKAIASSSSSSNIYTADGTLSANRTVTQDDKNLDFNSTTGNFVFNPSSTGNFGIGTPTPDRKLSVVQAGDGTPFISRDASNLMRFESTANGSSIGHYFKTKDAAGTPKDLVMGVNPTLTPGGSFFIGDGDGYDYITYNFATRNGYTNFFGGNFGVGTDIPSQKLDVAGNVKFSGALMPNNLPGVAGEVLTSAGDSTAPTWKKPTLNIYDQNAHPVYGGTDTDAVTVLERVANKTFFSDARMKTYALTNPTYAEHHKIMTITNYTDDGAGFFEGGNVGIRTGNPQGVFHIDGGQDNELGFGPLISDPNDLIYRFDDVEGYYNLGIGVVNPKSRLEVRGAATNYSSHQVTDPLSFLFNQSNLLWTNLVPGATTWVMQYLKDGGAYTLVVKSTVSGTPIFTGNKPGTLDPYTFHVAAPGPTTAGKHTMYNFIVMGDDVYVTWISGL